MLPLIGRQSTFDGMKLVAMNVEGRAKFPTAIEWIFNVEEIAAVQFIASKKDQSASVVVRYSGTEKTDTITFRDYPTGVAFYDEFREKLRTAAGADFAHFPVLR